MSENLTPTARATFEKKARLEKSQWKVIEGVPFTFAQKSAEFQKRPRVVTLAKIANDLKQRRAEETERFESHLSALVKNFPEVHSYAGVAPLADDLYAYYLIDLEHSKMRGAIHEALRLDFESNPPRVVFVENEAPSERTVSFEVLRGINASRGTELPELFVRYLERANLIATELRAIAEEDKQDNEWAEYLREIWARARAKDEFAAQFVLDHELISLRTSIRDILGIEPQIHGTERYKKVTAAVPDVRDIGRRADAIALIDEDLNKISAIWRSFRYSAIGQQVAADLESDTIDMLEFGEQFAQALNEPLPRSSVRDSSAWLGI